MRFVLHATLLALLVSALAGCTVMDEIDKAGAQMDKFSKNKSKAKVEATTTASAADAKTSPVLEDSKRWWKKATSLAPRAVDSSIVKCRLASGTEFRSKDDCLSRGGVPQGVSG
jgi:hypothetical protein